MGDSFIATVSGQPLPLKIVGSILDNAETNLDVPHNVVIRGDWATLAGADPTLQPSEWEVATNDLMSPASYAQQLREQTQGFADASTPSSADTDQGFLFFEGVIASLGAILVLVSLGGVANTVLLEARERLRETAILRALGMTPRQVVTMTVASSRAAGLRRGRDRHPDRRRHSSARRSRPWPQTALESSVPSLDHERIRPNRVARPDWRRARRRAGRSLATCAEICLDVHRRRARHRIAGSRLRGGTGLGSVERKTEQRGKDADIEDPARSGTAPTTATTIPTVPPINRMPAAIRAMPATMRTTRPAGDTRSLMSECIWVSPFSELTLFVSHSRRPRVVRQ